MSDTKLPKHHRRYGISAAEVYHTNIYTILNFYDGNEFVKDRTGVGRLRVNGLDIPHQPTKYNDGYLLPHILFRDIPIASPIGEMVGFLIGVTSADVFDKLGCKYWYQNANENQAWLNNPVRKGENDLGKIYGYQWRTWTDKDGNSIDQLSNVVSKLLDPETRTDARLIIEGWNAGELSEMALPPCHKTYHFIVDGEGRLDLIVYQRSADMVLGVPSNLIQQSFLHLLVCRWTGLKPGLMRVMYGDCHIYSNHVEAANAIIKSRYVVEQHMADNDIKILEPYLVFDQTISKLESGSTEEIDGCLQYIANSIIMGKPEQCFKIINPVTGESAKRSDYAIGMKSSDFNIPMAV